VAIECERPNFFMADWYAKDFESLIHASELKDVTCSNHALKGELVEANRNNGDDKELRT